MSDSELAIEGKQAVTDRARAPRRGGCNPNSTLIVVIPLGVRQGPGRPPRLSDAELVCLAVAQVLLGFDSERR